MRPKECINGHDHCFKDMGLNLAECQWCGLTVMHSLDHGDFVKLDCTDRPTDAEIAAYEDYMGDVQEALAEHQNDEPSEEDY